MIGVVLLVIGGVFLMSSGTIESNHLYSAIGALCMFFAGTRFMRNLMIDREKREDQ